MTSRDYTKDHIVIGSCRVCDGAVIRELRYITRDTTRRLKPEERNPYNTTITSGPAHCRGCGILYHFGSNADDAEEE